MGLVPWKEQSKEMDEIFEITGFELALLSAKKEACPSSFTPWLCS
jgi:hypothetical protein